LLADRKAPNSFAERFVYKAIALTPDGYQAAKHGFQIKREAYAFAANTVAPTAVKPNGGGDATP
jgi:hypothetical protein